MISVIFIWLYMMFTCYVIGFVCIKAITGSAKITIRTETTYLYVGIGAVTVYAQIFSIVCKVGFLANLILLLICLLCNVWCREELIEHFKTFRLTITIKRALPIVVLFLLFAYGASGGMIHYDTGLWGGFGTWKPS